MDYMGKFTEGAQSALSLSQESARELGHNYVGTEHLLLGLLKVSGSAAVKLLAPNRVSIEGVTDAIDRLVGRGDFQFTDAFGYTPRTKKVIELSLYEAKNMNHSYVGTEHLLLALVRERESIAARILADFGVDAQTIRTRLGGDDSPGHQGGKGGARKGAPTPSLDQYGKDLTRAAKDARIF